MAYFPANPGQERQRKSEKRRNYRSDHFLPDPKQGIKKKIAKKFKKLKKNHNRFFSSQNWLGKFEKK